MNTENAYTIEIDLGDLSVFYNEFNKDELSLAVINYIDREIAKTQGKEKITIRIAASFNVSKEQKEHMRATIQRHSAHVIHDVMVHKRYDDRKDMILCIVGVAIIVLADLARNLNTGFVTDLLLVVGSFAILQALTDIILADASRRIDLRRKRQLSTCKVIFVSDHEN